MPARWLYVSIIAAVGSLTAAAAEITATPGRSGGAVERGVAGLRCETDDDGLFSTSRGAILDLGAAAVADALLTTAHGLPADAAAVKRKCRVLVRGRSLAIADVVHVGGHLEGPEHDWAIVILERRMAGDVHRWRTARATPEWLAKAVADGAPVRLVLRHDDPAQTECRLGPPIPDPGVLFAHSCVAHPGTSGSPLIVAVDAAPEPVLFAIHVGTQMEWRGTKLDFYRVARSIDADIAAAIEAVARRTAVLASSESRRLARRTAETRGHGQKQ